jgi:transcriptional regulator with XRE-family HTH domain
MDVYRAIGLSNKSLSRYEKDMADPDPDTVRDLIRLYDVTSDYILGLSDDMGSLNPETGTSRIAPKISKDEELIKKLSSLPPEEKAKANEYVDMLKTLSEVKSGENCADFKKNG